MLGTSIRGRTGSGATHTASVETIGNATVLSVGESPSTDAGAIAEVVAPDTEYELVVADLPQAPSVRTWEALAEAVPRGRRGIRFVPVGFAGEATTMVGHWLAERLRRTVLIPHGALHQAANGGLFVHSFPGSGWLSCRPRQPSAWEAKRYPRPSWDSEPAGEESTTTTGGLCEPIPAGVWVHPDADTSVLARHRDRLVSGVPCQADVMTVVVGCPGTSAVSLDDIATVWAGLPSALRGSVRLACYGPVTLPSGSDFGQAVAERLCEPVVCYPGLPVGDSDWPEVHTVDPDGRQGWRIYAREVEYTPVGDAGSPASPSVRTHWLPFAGLTQAERTAYWYTPDAVLEVVHAGLWLRSPDGSAHAQAVRSQPGDHAGVCVFYDDATERDAVRMEWLARDVVTRMDPQVRTRAGIVASGSVERFPAHPGVLGGDSAGESEPQQDGPRSCADVTQPVPDRDAFAGVQEHGYSMEREWVRRNLGIEHESLAESVSHAIEQDEPGSLGPSDRDDVITDAVAVRLQLSARGDRVDRALRLGEHGPHVPLARCVSSGLLRLPVHRGAAGYVTTIDDRRLELYRELDTVVDWGFVNALAGPCAEQVGNVDVLLWSMTARQTEALEPEARERVLDRVMFLPGTRFRVLEVVPAQSDSQRGRLLLREMAPGETDDNSDVDGEAMDGLAAESLRSEHERWREMAPLVRTAGASRSRFADLPGQSPQ